MKPIKCPTFSWSDQFSKTVLEEQPNLIELSECTDLSIEPSEAWLECVPMSHSGPKLPPPSCPRVSFPCSTSRETKRPVWEPQWSWTHQCQKQWLKACKQRKVKSESSETRTPSTALHEPSVLVCDSCVSEVTKGGFTPAWLLGGVRWQTQTGMRCRSAAVCVYGTYQSPVTALPGSELSHAAAGLRGGHVETWHTCTLLFSLCVSVITDRMSAAHKRLSVSTVCQHIYTNIQHVHMI